jgi:LCP family protein required for cell wall assembly
MGVLKRNTRIISEHEKTGKTPVNFGRRQKKLREPRRKHHWKRWIITTACLLVVGALGFFGLKTYNSIKEVFSGNGDLLSLLGGSQGKLLKGEIDGRVNILLLGVGDEEHSGATLSDTMIVASYDTKSKSIGMISIPRDFYAKTNGGFAKLNTAHAYGEQKQEGSGPDTAATAIETISGLPIHYYARVDFTGLAEMVDAVGGVTVEVERDFCDYNYPGTRKALCFKAGSQNMDGAMALKYARSRHAAGPEGSDFARSKRQQRIIIALKEKVLSTETVFNPSKVLKIITTLGNHLKTDLGMDELSRVYEISKDIDTKAIVSKNLDPTTGLVAPSSGTAAGYVLIPTEGQGVYDDIHDFFKNIFAGVEIKKEAAKMSFLNGTWSTLYYTNLTNDFESNGVTIIADGGTKSRNTLVTTIVDYTGGQKSATIKYLEEKLRVKATAGTKTEGQTYDIQVILGKDYR